MTALYLFILGLIVGSFLNVVSLRYVPATTIKESWNVGGRSKCTSCNKTLSWYELIPVFSFIIQFGKCRSCGSKLSLQYPLVEIMSGLIFLLPFYFDPPQSFIWIGIFLIFLLIFTIDYRLYIIPDELNFLLAVSGIGLMSLHYINDTFGLFNGSFLGYYSAIFGLRENVWTNHVFAAIIAFTIFGLIHLLTKGKGMGFGDAKLILAIGLIMGWPDITLVITLSFLIGSLISIFLLTLKKKNMKSTLPFGPFIIVATIITIFWGNELLNYYFKVINLF